MVDSTYSDLDKLIGILKLQLRLKELNSSKSNLEAIGLDDCPRTLAIMKEIDTVNRDIKILYEELGEIINNQSNHKNTKKC